MEFLRETSELNSIMKSFSLLYLRVIKIQKAFKKKKQIDLYRMEMLRKGWEIQKDRM